MSSSSLVAQLTWQLSKSHVLFLSFETAKRPSDIDQFIPCWGKSPKQILESVKSAIPGKRCLLLIDSMTSVCTSTQIDLTTFLMTLLQPPNPQSSISLVAVYHNDVIQHSLQPYSPSPLTLLNFLATTIITVHSLAILLAEKQAQERSLGDPSFGLAEHKEGILIGLKSKSPGIVLQLEHRRKSGRGVLEWYFLPSSKPTTKEPVTLLDDHPSFRKQDSNTTTTLDTTFDLNLTDRQRLERDGVVLPYFDAQTPEGGTGGRILYSMTAEDDFDEEEDEI